MNIKDEGTKNLFFMVTCGEDHTFETLDAMKEHSTIPYKLQVWYALKNPINLEFYAKLLTYTDDVIISKAEHPFASCQGWAMIYNDYDYLWVFGSDCKPLPQFVEKVNHAFQFVPYTVCVGNVKYPQQPEFMISQTGAAPDLLQVFDRKGVNIIGGMCPSFRHNGHEIVEMALRIVSNRFQFISMKGLVKEIGPSAPENGGLNDYKPENIARNLEIVNRARDIVLAGGMYTWWSNKILEGENK